MIRRSSEYSFLLSLIFTLLSVAGYAKALPSLPFPAAAPGKARASISDSKIVLEKQALRFEWERFSPSNSSRLSNCSAKS